MSNGFLVGHGFLDTTSQLTTLCDVSACIGNIAHIGPEYDINGETWRFLDRSLEVAGTRVGWCMGARIDGGSYGQLFLSKRMIISQNPADGSFHCYEPEKEVVVKKVGPRRGEKSMTVTDTTACATEALIHILAWRALQGTATPWAIPHPYEIFGEYTPTGQLRRFYFCMNYVHAETLLTYLASNWCRTTDRVANTRFFLEMLGQFAYILHFLQVGLRLNHRDVKIDNIMIRRRTNKKTWLILADSQMQSEYAITLVDFGLACIECSDEGPTDIQTGAWFGTHNVCYKAGRDIAQLLYCIHCYYPLHEFLTAPVLDAVHRWMTIAFRGTEVNMLYGFTEKGEPASGKPSPQFHTGIYRFLQRHDVDPPACAPRIIFRETCHLLSTI